MISSWNIEYHNWIL